MKPRALVDHLRVPKNKDCPLHHGIDVYLTKVYGDDLGGIGHEGLYIPSSKEHKRAVAAKAKDKEKVHEKLIKERDLALEEVERISLEKKVKEKEYEERGRVNKDLQQKLEEFESARKMLQAQGKTEPALTDSDLENYRRLYQAFIKGIKNSAPKDKPPIKISVEQNFNISTLFKELCSKEKDSSYLFRGLDAKKKRIEGEEHKNTNMEAWRLIPDWEIKFINTKGFVVESKKKNKDLLAVDEGGPTREFFTQIWKNMESLGIEYKNKDNEEKIFKLFDTNEAGPLPAKDELFEELGEKQSEDLQIEVVEKAKKYYRALGRIMFRVIVSGHTFPVEAMPTFFRNVILREYEPKENKYHDDILKQTHEIGNRLGPKVVLGCTLGDFFSKKDDGIDEAEIITTENYFTSVIQTMYVTSRKIAISSIKEGLTLDGAVDLIGLFRSMPLSAVTALAFGKSHVDVEDLIRIIKVEYDEEHGDKKTQDMFVYDYCLIPVLRDRKDDETFLSDFLRFVTGQYYLPDERAQPDFCITAEFAVEENFKEDALPVSHSCVNLIKFPSSAYNLDREVFEMNLNTSLEHSKCTFGMG